MDTGRIVALADSLVEAAGASNQRRLLVLSGDREAGYTALAAVLEALPVGITETTLVGPDDRLRCEQLPQATASDLLGTTRRLVAFDAHEECRPNALGKTVGAVDGGGLFVLLVPPLETWPERRVGFDESMAVPPFELGDVSGRFRQRLVETLRAHPGVAIVDLEGGQIVDDGSRTPRPPPSCSRVASRERENDPSPVQSSIEEACLTGDQAEAVTTLEQVAPATGSDEPRAVVLEADRGRGKSSAAGLAAAGFAAEGADILVTAPAWRNAREVFTRVGAHCEVVDPGTEHQTLETASGGRVRYESPADAVDRCEQADVVIVDEAAALPVRVLESLLAADRIAFATTIHGYEGAGRGFSVRFRDRLAASDHAVSERRLDEPIRYAAGDPLEVWAFNALLLDARPPVSAVVADATPETVSYRTLEPAALLADETLLREVFGLLVLAHYRTEPNDLARVLDAPNLAVRALCHDGHVVSVALLAREGSLSAETRAAMYEGERIPGNMIPDVLTSQLRDEEAGRLGGVRVVRIATHHAVRRAGLGSHLLEQIRAEYGDHVDWLGAGFGATPALVRFWQDNGYRPIHVSTTRNDASGEYSAIVLQATSEAGERLRQDHETAFARRIGPLCTDSLADLEPDLVRTVFDGLGSETSPSLDLTEQEWQVVAGAAYGPGLFDVDPGAFRPLVARYLREQPTAIDLAARQERLLVRRVLQATPWQTVADELGYHSAGQCMRALGETLQPLVDHYGRVEAQAVRDRLRD